MTSRGVGVGIVGMGFMGLTHLNAAAHMKGGRVVAMVTSDPRKARGDFRQVDGSLALGGDVAALDAGTRTDPLVGGIHGLLEVEVRDDLFRQVRTRTGDT